PARPSGLFRPGPEGTLKVYPLQLTGAPPAAEAVAGVDLVQQPGYLSIVGRLQPDVASARLHVEPRKEGEVLASLQTRPVGLRFRSQRRLPRPLLQSFRSPFPQHFDPTLDQGAGR